MEDERCRRATEIERIDAAFRAGDLAALEASVRGRWVIPNGPMPLEIGSCLEYAIYHSPLGFVHKLLEAGADPTPDDHGGFPPLIAALTPEPREDVVSLVRLLLSYGADPDQRGMNDYTALQVAVIEGRKDIVTILLAAGADPGLRTRIDNLESALDLALEGGDREIIRLLREATSGPGGRC